METKETVTISIQRYNELRDIYLESKKEKKHTILYGKSPWHLYEINTNEDSVATLGNDLKDAYEEIKKLSSENEFLTQEKELLLEKNKLKTKRKSIFCRLFSKK